MRSAKVRSFVIIVVLMQPIGVHTPFAGKINARCATPVPCPLQGRVQCARLFGPAPLLPDRTWNALTVRQFPLVRSRLR